MAYEWRCRDCGQGWPEPGRGEYVLTAGQHMKRQGHQPQGLVDLDTGEVVVAGSINRNAAEKLGIIVKPDRRAKKLREADAPAHAPPAASAPDDPSPPPRTKGVAAPVTGPGADPAFTGGVRTVAQPVDRLEPGAIAPPPAQVLSFDVQWPSWALAYFDLLRPDIMDDDGRPYEWGSKAFVRFVLDTYRASCRQLVARVMDQKLAGVDAAQAAKAVAATVATIEGMDMARVLALRAAQVQAQDPAWAAALHQAAQGG